MQKCAPYKLQHELTRQTRALEPSFTVFSIALFSASASWTAACIAFLATDMQLNGRMVELSVHRLRLCPRSVLQYSSRDEVHEPDGDNYDQTQEEHAEIWLQHYPVSVFHVWKDLLWTLVLLEPRLDWWTT